MSSQHASNLPEVQALIDYLKDAREDHLKDGAWIERGATLWRKAQAKCGSLSAEAIAQQADIDIVIVNATSLGAAYTKRMGGVLAAMFSDNYPAAALSVYLASSAGFAATETKDELKTISRGVFRAAYGSFLGAEATEKVLKSVVMEDLNRYLNFAKTSGAKDLRKEYENHEKHCAKIGKKPLDKDKWLNARIDEVSFTTKLVGGTAQDIALIATPGANKMGTRSVRGVDSCIIMDDTIYLHHATADTSTWDQRRQALNAYYGAMHTTRQFMAGSEENPLFGHAIEMGYLIAGRLDTNNIDNVRHGDGSGYHARKALAACKKAKTLTQDDVYGLGQMKIMGLVAHCDSPTELAMLLSCNIHVTGTPTLDLYGASRTLRTLLEKSDFPNAQELAIKTMAGIVARSAKCLTHAALEENSTGILMETLDEISIAVNMARQWAQEDPRHGRAFLDAGQAVARMLDGHLATAQISFGVTGKLNSIRRDLAAFHDVMAGRATPVKTTDIAIDPLKSYNEESVYAPAPEQDYLAQERQHRILSEPAAANAHKRARQLHDIDFQKLVGKAKEELAAGGVPLDNQLGRMLNFLEALNPVEKRDRGLARDLAQKQPRGIFGVRDPGDGTPKTLREHAEDFGITDSTYISGCNLFNYHNLDNGQRERSRYPLTRRLLEVAHGLVTPHFLDHGQIFKNGDAHLRGLTALAKAHDCVYSSTKASRTRSRKPG